MKYLLSLLLLATTLVVNAQQDNDVPANAEPGKCYARCYVPDQYEQQNIQVIERAASQRVVVIPAEYETVIDTIVSRAASYRSEVIPATYESIAETIMVSNATTKWVKGQADASCLNDNPDNCRVLCLVQVPAQYKVQMRKVMATPAYSKQIEIPAEYKYIPRRVLRKAEEQQVIEVPAVFRTETQNVLVRRGGFSEWREVLCANQLTEERIVSIQRALQAKGYDPGPIDNVFGAKTKAALLRFQRDSRLPEGNLNLETLTALGIN